MDEMALIPYTGVMSAPALAILLAVADPRLAAVLERVSEEARVFAEKSPRVVGVERFTQRGRLAPPRFRLRKGANPNEAPALGYRQTAMVSEYGFGTLKEAPGDIREIRRVISVNGRPVDENRPQARLTLSEGMASDADRLNKQMLQDMEAHGLVGAVSDLGQMLLMFTRGQLKNYRFSFESARPAETLQGTAVTVLRYKQKDDEEQSGARLYAGQELHRIPLEGELWVRASDGLPLRITARITAREGRDKAVHLMTVDYAMGSQGVLLPARTTYSRRQKEIVYVESEAVYSDFKMFGADANIKFTVDDEAPAKP